MKRIVILLATLSLVTGCSAEPDAELGEVTATEAAVAPSIETENTKTTTRKTDAGAQQDYLKITLNDLLVTSY